MQRFGLNICAAALWPAVLLISQSLHAQSTACCSVGQSRMECLEQREKYWNQGIACQNPPQISPLPGGAATVGSLPTIRSLQNSALPLCCTSGQSRMECLEQREKYWNQGIACQDLAATPLSNGIATTPAAQGVTKASAVTSAGSAMPTSSTAPPAAPALAPVSAGTAAPVTGTVSRAAPAPAPINTGTTAPVAGTVSRAEPPPANAAVPAPSAPARADAEAPPRASQSVPTSAAAPVTAASTAPKPDVRPLSPAKSELPPCCTKGQSRMDCLEQRERNLTMGVACEGGK